MYRTRLTKPDSTRSSESDGSSDDTNYSEATPISLSFYSDFQI